MSEAFVYDAIRTPRGKGKKDGSLHEVKPISLLSGVLRELQSRNQFDTAAVDDVVMGVVSPIGEQGSVIPKVAALAAGWDWRCSGVQLNRFCASGLEAVNMAAMKVRSGWEDLVVAGGVESMSRAPFVMPKAETAFSRNNAVYDTTIGWRFINKLMKAQYGVDSMPETAENVATDYKIEREAQDLMAYNSQLRAVAAIKAGHLAREIVGVSIPQKKGDAIIVDTDEHPRETSLEALAKLKGVVRPDGSVTAGNASGVNDGAAALIIASQAAVERFDLKPMARILGTAVAGVAPRIMGIGPAPASEKLLQRLGLTLSDIDLIELNEAFAAQGLACLRELGVADDDARVNPNGGAIALGHPLGMSGARLALTAARELRRRNGRYALCTMCIGVGQGFAMIIERV